MLSAKEIQCRAQVNFRLILQHLESQASLPARSIKSVTDVRVTMPYVKMFEDGKRVTIDALKLTWKVGQILATWPKQPQLPVAVSV